MRCRLQQSSDLSAARLGCSQAPHRPTSAGPLTSMFQGPKLAEEPQVVQGLGAFQRGHSKALRLRTSLFRSPLRGQGTAGPHVRSRSSRTQAPTGSTLLCGVQTFSGPWPRYPGSSGRNSCHTSHGLCHRCTLHTVIRNVSTTCETRNYS